jgi:ribosome recycling factor
MDLASYQKKVDQSLQYLQGEFGGLQLWRATPGLIENISVEASYGHMKLNQLGHVSVLDSQTLKVECRDKWEMKSVEKAIYDANIWLTPQNDGGYLIIRIPALTQERRLDLVKHVKTLWEETKAQIRRIRQDAMKDTKDLFVAKEIGEDLHKRNEEDIESMVKKANAKVDEMVDQKGEEVMKV